MNAQVKMKSVPNSLLSHDKPLKKEANSRMIAQGELAEQRTSVRTAVINRELVLTRYILAIAFVSGLFLRLWLINAMGYNTDEAVYAGQGAAIAGVPILSKIFPVFRAHPLLFQFLLSLLYRIYFSDLAGRLLAAAVGMGTIFITYQAGKILYGRLPGALAALFMAVMPYHVLVSRQVLLDGPMVFFATLTLYFMAVFGKTQNRYWLYLSAAGMGLTFLSKETSIILLVVIYTFIALASDIKIRMADAVIFLLIWIVIISPFPISLLLAGTSSTGRNFVVWQLFRRPNHEWSFYLTTLPPYIGILLLVAAVLSLILLWRDRSWREKLLVLWIVIQYAFFQLWPVKGFQYLLPLAPAVALLAGRVLGKLTEKDKEKSSAAKVNRLPFGNTVAWIGTAAIVVTMTLTSWQGIQPRLSAEFLAGTGGVPGGREAGTWVKENVPLNATLMTIGPSMANIIKFYGEREALGLSVSPNPLYRNPAYIPISNPDEQIRHSEIQYLVWDSFSAARSSFFSTKLLAYVHKYNGIAVYSKTIEVLNAQGEPVVTPIIIIYEVHP
jgi:hypothetical protein